MGILKLTDDQATVKVDEVPVNDVMAPPIKALESPK